MRAVGMDWSFTWLFAKQKQQQDDDSSMLNGVKKSVEHAQVMSSLSPSVLTLSTVRPIEICAFKGTQWSKKQGSFQCSGYQFIHTVILQTGKALRQCQRLWTQKVLNVIVTTKIWHELSAHPQCYL